MSQKKFRRKQKERFRNGERKISETVQKINPLLL